MVLAMQILIVLSILIFLIGLIKPKWVLFWMKEPDRLWATTLGLFLFMGSFTAYSEMRLRHKQAQAKGTAPTQERSLDNRNELQLSR
jgi:hypothetical protein